MNQSELDSSTPKLLEMTQCFFHNHLNINIMTTSTYNTTTITPREKEVLYLTAHEYTITMIAAELFISHHTVISHRKNLLIKMDVKNVAGLVRRGFELGLLVA